MEHARDILNASRVWQALMALCVWCGAQWRASGLAQWFLHPGSRGRAAAEHSVFYRLWTLFRDGLSWLYDRLRLERLFAGSVFGKTWFWCVLPAALAPLAPTMAVLGLSLVGFCAVLLALARDRARRSLWNPTGRYVLLYAAIYLAATFVSVDLKSSLNPGLLTVAFILFSLALYSAVTNRRQLDVAVTLLVLAGAAVSVYGILQYVFRWGYQSAAWVDSDMFSSISFRASSTLENPNMLGQYLLLIIPLGGAKLLAAKGWWSRLFYLACCGLMCVCMLLTMSRGAWLGLLAAGAVFFVMLNARLLLLAPAALAVMWLVLPATVLTRFTSIGNLGDASSSYRMYIWLGTLDMLRDYWLCGIGPGNEAFNAVYAKYSFSAVTAPHSHNLYLQIMCDAGVAALVVFLILLFVYFRTMGSAVSREKDWTSRLYQTAFTSGMVGFLLQAMTDFSFYNYRVLFLFWACLALGIASAHRSQMPEGRAMA
jgi:O-antigen ligase